MGPTALDDHRVSSTRDLTMYDDVRYETEAGSATITIDRPEAYHAFTKNPLV